MTNAYDPTYVSYPSVPVAGQADNEHLRILVICQYIWAGLSGVFGLFPCIHILLGIMTLRGARPGLMAHGAPDVAMGWIFIIVGSSLVLFFETCALLSLLSAVAMGKRRYYRLIMISAGVNCIYFPMGTTLGVFTYIVTLRPTVKAQFLGPYPG